MNLSTPFEAADPSDSTPPNRIKTLLLDDSNFDRERIRRIGAKTNLIIDFDEVGSIQEMDAAVTQSSYDLILIDYRLPVGDGLTALEHIKQNELNKDAGTIMITGDGGLNTAVAAMRNGCHDYLSKDDMDCHSLRTAMVNAMDTAQRNREVAQQAEYHREIIRQGLTSALMDQDVQNTFASLIREQMASQPPAASPFAHQAEPEDLQLLVAALAEDDEFQFH